MARLRVLVGAVLAAALVAGLRGPRLGERRRDPKVRASTTARHPAVTSSNGAKTLHVPTDPQRLPQVPGTYNSGQGPRPPRRPGALEADVRLGRPTIAAIGSLPATAALQLGRDRDTLPPPDPAAGGPHQPRRPGRRRPGQAGSGSWVRVVRDLEFGEASGYLLAPAGKYRLRIVAAGTSTVVKDLGKVRLKGSTSYTAWAVGFLTPENDYPGFDVFVSVDG